MNGLAVILKSDQIKFRRENFSTIAKKTKMLTKFHWGLFNWRFAWCAIFII